MARIGIRRMLRAGGFGLVLGTCALAPRGAVATVQCPSQGNQMLPQGGDGEDLEVVGTCVVGGGTYTYGYVNVFGTASTPAILRFRDAKTTFSAKSILVGNYGFLFAGCSSTRGEPRPIGTKAGSKLTIRLYGSEGDRAISCKSGSTCGVDPAIWNSNVDPTQPPVQSMLPGGS